MDKNNPLESSTASENIFAGIKDMRDTEGISELRRVQYVGLWMLEIVDAVCKKHNITYWLDGGLRFITERGIM